MLHVILQILGIIGIVLLCLLGLLLFLILLVLFVPIRYRLTGYREGDTLTLAARVTYLLHLLSVRFDYPEPGSVIVKVLGIRIFDTAKLKEKKENTDEETSPEDSEENENREKEENSPEKSNQGNKTENVQKDNEESVEIKETEENKDSADNVNEKKTLIARIKEIFQKIQYTIRSICDKIKSGLQKAEELKETVAYYNDTLTKRENRRLYSRAKKRLFKVLKSIRPRVLKADLHIGTGSPDTTGYLCAVYGMLSPVLGNNVKMTPDFEETVWEGRIYIKGRITIFTILWQALGIVLDKQLRTFIKELKREEK